MVSEATLVSCVLEYVRGIIENMNTKRILVLVVEDEEAISRALRDFLTHAGNTYEVAIAEDGVHALEKISAEAFDLVLLDIIMPKMDGWQFLEEIKKRGIKTKVVILTNLDQDESKARARELGVTDYFVKNETTLAMLTERIKSLLAE